MQAGSILVADDDAAIRTVLNQALSRAGYEVRSTGNATTLWRWVSQGEGDLVITDVVMPDENAFDMLPRIKKLRPDLPVVVMSAQNTLMTAIRASERGAYDYLPKPFDLKELIAIVGRALTEPKTKQASRGHEDTEAMPLVGRSAAMQEIYRVLARLMQTDLTVMITGESGTGKELIAQAIHRLSRRSEGSFIDLNCAAFQESLLESELFGYEAGAFSGAKGRKLGLWELADNGTIFLDEVTELPPQLQSKLLRAIETNSFFRVGAVRKVQVNVRIVAATNRDIGEVTSDGRFRADLLYRINSFQINLPPLRERPEDIEPIARHLLTRLSGPHAPALTPEVLSALQSYSWPGNVRQLRNTLERAVLLANDGRITTSELPPEIVSPALAYRPAASAAAPGLGDAQGAAAPSVPPPLREVERQQILAALEQTGWHRGKTAEILGISPSTLYRRLRDYNLTKRQ
jgi:two-component system, NtrC family, nitrogen regulation response regulator GlnG